MVCPWPRAVHLHQNYVRSIKKKLKMKKQNPKERYEQSYHLFHHAYTKETQNYCKTIFSFRVFSWAVCVGWWCANRAYIPSTTHHIIDIACAFLVEVFFCGGGCCLTRSQRVHLWSNIYFSYGSTVSITIFVLIVLVALLLVKQTDLNKSIAMSYY